MRKLGSEEAVIVNREHGDENNIDGKHDRTPKYSEEEPEGQASAAAKEQHPRSAAP
jgi:hypothetical protein